MDRANQVLTAALTRPINLAAPGAGLLLALTYAPWWMFPLSLLPYLIMVILTARDPKFIERTLSTERESSVGDRIDWATILRESQGVELTAPLARLAQSEQKLAAEVAAAPSTSRAMMAACLGQVRSAARLGIELARRLTALDRALMSGPDPARSRYEAQERRSQAERSRDGQARQEFMNAARSLEEAAAHTESMQTLRERTLAQLESLTASLESASVRAVRLRIATGGDVGGATAITEALRTDVDTVRETLSAFEQSSIDLDAVDEEVGESPQQLHSGPRPGEPPQQSGAPPGRGGRMP